MSSSTMTTAFDDVPNEILFMIFNYLKVRSLVNCRMVSKRWKALVDQVKPIELVFNFKRVSLSPYWYSTGDLIDEESMVNSLPRGGIDFVPFDISKLRRLKFCVVLDCRDVHDSGKISVHKFDFKVLNQFVDLVWLELPALMLDGEETLSLPNLNVLFIAIIEENSLILDLPNLEKMSCEFGLANMKFLHPKSIRELHLSVDEGNRLEIFENLEVLKSDFPSTLNNVLTKFQKLKQLKLIRNQDFFSFYGLIEQKKELGLDNLEIYCIDTLLEDDKKFEDCVSPFCYADLFEIQ